MKKIPVFFPPDLINSNLVENNTLYRLAADGDEIGNDMLLLHYLHTVMWQFHVQKGGQEDGWLEFMMSHEIHIVEKPVHPAFAMEDVLMDCELSPVSNCDRFEEPNDDKDIIYLQPTIANIAGINGNKTSRIEKFMQENGIRYYHGKNGNVWTTSDDMEDYFLKKYAENDPTNSH